MRPLDELEAFVSRIHPTLIGALTLYCGRSDVGQELAQEALARLCLHWHRVKKMDNPTSWVYRIALNLANSHLRRKIYERRALIRAQSIRRLRVGAAILGFILAVGTATTLAASGRLSRPDHSKIALPPTTSSEEPTVGQSNSSLRPSPPPHDSVQGRLIPKTFTSDGEERLPVMFPDGSIAELAYPTDVALSKMGVRPYVTIAPDFSCGSALVSYYNHEDWYKGSHEPLATYAGADGQDVELWRVPDALPTERYLIFHFGYWSVGIPDGAGCPSGEDLRERLASGLHGEETAAGFLHLTADESFGLTSEGAEGSVLAFGAGPEIEVFLADCEAFRGEQNVGGKPLNRVPGFADWCFPEESVRVQIAGTNKLIDDVFMGLEVQNLSDEPTP